MSQSTSHIQNLEKKKTIYAKLGELEQIDEIGDLNGN